MGNTCVPIYGHFSYLRTLRQPSQPGDWLATSCSAAVAGLQKSNITNVALYNPWTKLPFTFGNSLLSQQQANSLFMETSLGWGNYNAAIVSLTGRNYHGLTVRPNFTWSRSRGTGDTTQSYLSIFVGRNLLQQQTDGMGERRSHFTVQRGPLHPLRRHSFKRLWLCRQRSERHRN